MIRLAPTKAAVLITPNPIAPHPKTATEEPSASTNKLLAYNQQTPYLLIPGCFTTAPQAVVIPHPSRQTFSKGAFLFTATTDTSATTVY